MKIILLSVLFIAFSVNAQKFDEAYFKELKEIEYTNFVVTYSKTLSKVRNNTNDKLVFIETQSNTSKEVALENNSSISSVTTKFESKYQDAAFVLVETFVNVDRSNIKINHPVRELYLIKLTTFETIKLTSNNFTLISWAFNETAGTLVVLEKENDSKNGTSSVQKIVTTQLKTGVSKEVYKIN